MSGDLFDAYGVSLKPKLSTTESKIGTSALEKQVAYHALRNTVLRGAHTY